MSDAPTRRFDGTTVIDNPVGYRIPLGGIRVSFEADEQGAVTIQVPFRARVTRVRSIVVKALSAGNVGELAFTSPDGEFADLSHTDAAPVGQSRSSSAAISTNSILEAGEDITITPTKVTDGGKVSVDLDLLRMEGP